MSRKSQSLFFSYHTVLPIAGLWSPSVSNCDAAICAFFVCCLFVLFCLLFSPRPARSVGSGNNLMRLAIILQHAIMAYHVQIAHELHVISRLDSCRVRKSCYLPILRLRRLSLIVHSWSNLVHVYLLLYNDITACKYGDLVLGECGGAHGQCNAAGCPPIALL